MLAGRGRTGWRSPRSARRRALRQRPRALRWPER